MFMLWFSFRDMIIPKNMRRINEDCEVNLNCLMEKFDSVHEVKCNLAPISCEFLSKHAVA